MAKSSRGKWWKRSRTGRPHAAELARLTALTGSCNLTMLQAQMSSNHECLGNVSLFSSRQSMILHRSYFCEFLKIGLRLLGETSEEKRVRKPPSS